ncbi:MAG: thioredoxin domain-containing protein, partial [Anaerolineae bacterium]
MANRLVAASSLYLSQHADNPVDWYAWGEEAFARARAEDKPVFLSIGYSACHWCHVMARESFSSVAVAAILNEHFICIKVDREERPDVDAAYMEAVGVMTGHGGWPLSVFLTPDGTPFYGGTYYPPAPRSGMPGFPQILAAVVDAWTNRRREVLQGGRRLAAAVARSARWSEAATGDGPGAEAVDAAVAALASGADRLHGGFGAAPKFPQAPALAFLLGRHARRPGGDQGALEVALAALGGMIRGGIHDQLAGGFHRYSVDEAWTVPHFEKMLTDNAQLAWLCAAAWQISGVERFRQVAGSTMDFLVEDLRGSHGAFLAAIDADSEGEEGAYYLWSTSEIDAALDPEAAAVARLWYGVTPAGNFEGRNVLTARADAEAAATLGLSEEAFRAAGRRARMALLAARRRRPAPRVDPKVVV